MTEIPPFVQDAEGNSYLAGHKLVQETYRKSIYQDCNGDCHMEEALPVAATLLPYAGRIFEADLENPLGNEGRGEGFSYILPKE